MNMESNEGGGAYMTERDDGGLMKGVKELTITKIMKEEKTVVSFFETKSIGGTMASGGDSGMAKGGGVGDGEDIKSITGGYYTPSSITYPVDPSVPKDPLATSDIMITGIIGTNKQGFTFSPQKYIYIYDGKNKQQHELAMLSVQKGAREWNAIDGCVAEVFSFSITETSYPAITAISGISHGFKSGTITNTVKTPVKGQKDENDEKCEPSDDVEDEL